MFLSVRALGLATAGPLTVPQMLCNCDFTFASGKKREDPDLQTLTTKSIHVTTKLVLVLNAVHDGLLWSIFCPVTKGEKKNLHTCWIMSELAKMIPFFYIFITCTITNIIMFPG